MKDLSLFETIHLLSILRRGDDAYGVTIREEIFEMTRRDIPYGTLYSYLDQLFKKGLVQKYAGDPTPERGGRRKIYYTLTAKGKRSLREAYHLQQAIWKGTPILVLEQG